MMSHVDEILKQIKQIYHDTINKNIEIIRFWKTIKELKDYLIFMNKYFKNNKLI